MKKKILRIKNTYISKYYIKFVSLFISIIKFVNLSIFHKNMFNEKYFQENCRNHSFSYQFIKIISKELYVTRVSTLCPYTVATLNDWTHTCAYAGNIQCQINYSTCLLAIHIWGQWLKWRCLWGHWSWRYCHRHHFENICRSCTDDVWWWVRPPPRIPIISKYIMYKYSAYSEVLRG